VAFEWGELTVSCLHPDRVQVSTTTTDAGDEGLLISRVRYRFAVVLERGELPVDRRYSAVHIDKTWYLDRSNYWSLRRVNGGGEATATAEGIVRQHLLPAIAAWLRTEPAAELLAEGRRWWFADLVYRADEVQATLESALRRVRALRARAVDGDAINDLDETYLRTLRIQSY
jgi:hypothetical protein